MKIRVSDYIANFLADNSISHIFTVTGGGAMHLNDAFGHNKRLKCIYNHHEQACAMAAEGYTRVKGKITAICVTTGPGGTNALTGVLGAWLDSIPMLIISGQVKFETTVESLPDLKLRQIGDQEFNIVKCVSSMTKFANMITAPEDIRYYLEKALYIAQNGRPGPVWLDIPMNIQSAIIETDNLKGYDYLIEKDEITTTIDKEIIEEVLEKIKTSKRPVIYAGMGIHLSNSERLFIEFAEKFNIPVVAGFNASDCLPYNHNLYIGRPGTIGDRAGNFAVQNSDLLIILGCRLNIRQTGYYFESFAREAYKIMIDIDENEMKKPMLKIDFPIHADVNQFLELIIKRTINDLPDFHEWINWCLERKNKYPVVLKEYYDIKTLVNPYCFMEELSNQLNDDEIVVAANATACICSFQAMKLKNGQRLFSNSGAASMGYDLPASIGACIANNKGRVICLAGDGSIQMNIQELQTIIHNKLPVKIFYLNNNGYHSIRQTQRNFFGEPLVGCEPDNGVSFPDIEKIAYAYGFPFIRCINHTEMKSRIAETLDIDGYCICEVILDSSQGFAPKPSSIRLENGKMVSRPLEDLAPFLDRNDYLSNMIIKPIE